MSFGASKPGFSFGTTPAAGGNSAFGFGATSSIGFGTNMGGATPTFGAPSVAPTFGAPSATPTFGTPSATPTFGTPSATPTFGTPSATPTFGTPTFGIPSATPAFGTPSATPAFGTPSATPAFGTPSATPAFGASTFGTPTNTSTFGTPTATSGFGMQAPTPAFGTPSTTPGFGTPSAVPVFGTPSSTPAFGTPSAAPAFGTTSFGTPSATPTFGTSSLTSGIGTSLATPAFGTQSSSAPTFGLSASAPSFGTPSTTSAFGISSAGPSFSLGGNSNFASGGPCFTNSSTLPSYGLGGTTPSSVAITANSNSLLSSGIESSSKNDPKALKESQIPNEISQTIEEFKKYVKEERSTSSDIAHISSRIHTKIKKETESLATLVTLLSSGLRKNKVLLDKLKLEVGQELLNAEIGQRTKDTPPALQYENGAPLEYFSRLVSSFENDMLRYRQQIEDTETHAMSSSSSSPLNPEDLSKTIHKMHEAFTSLAGRFQTVHEAVLHQKAFYLKTHREAHEVESDVFSDSRTTTPSNKTINSSFVKLTEGPSPFSQTRQDRSIINFGCSNQANGFNSIMTTGGPPTWGLGTPVSSFGNTNSHNLSSSGPGFSSFGTTSTINNNNSFTGNHNNSFSSQPGLFGSTMGSFGNNNTFTTPITTNNNNNSSLAGNKRGKH